MFQRTLTEVDKIFSNKLNSKITLEQWREKQDIFVPIFNEDIGPLIEICLNAPFDVISKYSKYEDIIWQPNGCLINEFRIRPKNDYYEALHRLIPQPDNPEGPSAAGIELSIGACRGMSSDKVIRPPIVVIKFEIWGHREREKFLSFYKNYRRPIELLLKDLGLDFFTSCCFKNLGKYTGTEIMKKLDLYLANKKDDEACFALEKTFNKNSKLDSVVKVFKAFLIIYHSCFGYCQKNEEPDRILHFFKFAD